MADAVVIEKAVVAEGSFDELPVDVQTLRATMFDPTGDTVGEFGTDAVWRLRLDGELVGFAWTSYDAFQPSLVFISEIGVARAHRSKGYDRASVAAIAGDAVGVGRTEVGCITSPFGEAQRRQIWLERCGFVRVRAEDFYFLGGAADVATRTR